MANERGAARILGMIAAAVALAPAGVMARLAASRDLTTNPKGSAPRGMTWDSAQNGGRRHTVAMDKRAARKARNRARARRCT